MARPKLAIRSIEKNISIPEDLAARVDLELFSEIEGRVPFGAWKGFITRIIRQYLESRGRQEALYKRLTEIAETTLDQEHSHSRMDQALLEELAALGYHKAVSTYRSVPKWYA